VAEVATNGYYLVLRSRERVREVFFLLLANLRALRSDSFSTLFEDAEEYRELLNKHSGMNLQSARVFEIGYGRRPDRLLALVSQGIDALGVDICAPLLELTPGEILKTFRLNGLQSAIRSLARYLLFDVVRRHQFAKELFRRGYRLRIEGHRFLVQDISTLELPERCFDMIFSEDVFEHIPEEDLHIILPKLSRWLKPSGICLIRPDIFTGVWGGHLCERLYSGDGRHEVIEPWEHLRKKRFRPTVYVKSHDPQAI
jgi:Methyltransferase domain